MAEMVDRDAEHLRLLTIGYNVLAGMTAFFSLFALLYVGFGVFMASGAFPINQSANNDPRPVGYILIAIGAAVFIFGMAVAALYFAVGRSLRNRRPEDILFCNGRHLLHLYSLGHRYRRLYHHRLEPGRGEAPIRTEPTRAGWMTRGLATSHYWGQLDMMSAMRL